MRAWLRSSEPWSWPASTNVDWSKLAGRAARESEAEPKGPASAKAMVEIVLDFLAGTLLEGEPLVSWRSCRPRARSCGFLGVRTRVETPPLAEMGFQVANHHVEDTCKNCDGRGKMPRRALNGRGDSFFPECVVCRTAAQLGTGTFPFPWGSFREEAATIPRVLAEFLRQHLDLRDELGDDGFEFGDPNVALGDHKPRTP